MAKIVSNPKKTANTNHGFEHLSLEEECKKFCILVCTEQMMNINIKAQKRKTLDFKDNVQLLNKIE
jgi:hypothetical protein